MVEYINKRTAPGRYHPAWDVDWGAWSQGWSSLSQCGDPIGSPPQESTGELFPMTRGQKIVFLIPPPKMPEFFTSILQIICWGPIVPDKVTTLLLLQSPSLIDSISIFIGPIAIADDSPNRLDR
jgi:hypothetical protein